MNKDTADIEPEVGCCQHWTALTQRCIQVMDHTIRTAKMHYDQSKAKNHVKAKKFLSEVYADKPLPKDLLKGNKFLMAKRQEREEKCRRITKEIAALAMEEAKAHASKRGHSSQVIGTVSSLGP